MDIIGVTQLRNTFIVYSATRKVADGSCASNILKCQYCSLTQKKTKCKGKCHVYVKLSQDNSQSAITFFHKEIEKIFNI